MNGDLYTGRLVRLTAEEPDTLGEALSRWGMDSEYWRLLSDDPARLYSKKAVKEWFEKNAAKEPPDNYEFGIRTLADDRLIGFVGLDGIQWTHGDAYVGIGIGEREDWGKGFGTDAMQLILRYAFTELNLHRVSLTVFEYNPRAIHSYEKAGFVYEGQGRDVLYREGRRWDMICMGILRSDWQRLNSTYAEQRSPAA